MKPAIRITITDDQGNKFFGEGPCQLLHAVEKTGSLRAAAISMEMAYSKAMKLLKQAECALGFPLTVRVTGGKDGGGSQLTPEAKLWLTQYETYRDACMEANKKLFREMFPKTGCVIMASGLGKRFGSNKLMADFQGKPMILSALQASEGLSNHRVVVTRHEDVAALCRQLGVHVLLHDLPNRNDTVRLGLEALGDLDGCLFMPGDQPLLRRATVDSLVQQWTANQKCILRPSCNQTPGAPVLFPRWTFPELMSLPEGKGGGWLISKYPQHVREMIITDPLELTDADTPETLNLLKQHIEIC